MTGLIWKDFLIMRKTLKSYLLIMALYAVLAYLDILNYGFIITFIQVALMVLPISAFAYDEQAKWDRYAMSLPMGCRAMVGARYLFVLTLSLLTTALGLASIALLTLFRAEDPVEMVVTLMVSAAIGLLIPSFLLPLCYKLGPERARPFLYAIIFIPTIVLVLLFKANILDLSILENLDVLTTAQLIGYALLLPLGGLALLALSCLVSFHIAAGKEY
ncbi:ABC-2 transporter permease [Pseudoflavonifractor sp. 60]|uniref:ABC-2 transporter permease n=1 Tax=Pseudoflavonifractor sp. 60 TaxID=2304576 RepID=UPI00136BEC74|nr:ABC-2 transporter permease [Pseudoflavonifractor sp. 60]